MRVNETELAYANRTKHLSREFMLNVRHWGKVVTVARFLQDIYRYGLGDTDLKSALLVKDAYHKWFDGQGKLNWTLYSEEVDKMKMNDK